MLRTEMLLARLLKNQAVLMALEYPKSGPARDAAAKTIALLETLQLDKRV